MLNKLLIALVFISLSKLIFAQNTPQIEQVEGVEVGSIIPAITAVDQHGAVFDFHSELLKGKLVVVFYRGQWCPICNRHLSALQDSLNLILEKGARVVAISPEKPAYQEETIRKTDAEFVLLFDEDYKICEAFDVLFQPTKKQVGVYNTFLNAKLKTAHSDSTQRLPVPATFIINNNGEIIWRHFDRDYKNRSIIQNILKQL